MSTTTQAPIIDPILLDMNQPFGEASEGRSSEDSIIVAVKNMLIYAALQEDKHFTLVIDEDVEQPIDIPEEFLHHAEDDEVEVSFVLPSQRTTTGIPVLSSTDNEDASTSVTTATASSSVVDAVSGIDESQVLNNRWFSDIDEGSK